MSHPPSICCSLPPSSVSPLSWRKDLARRRRRKVKSCYKTEKNLVSFETMLFSGNGVRLEYFWRLFTAISKEKKNHFFTIKSVVPTAVSCRSTMPKDIFHSPNPPSEALWFRDKTRRQKCNSVSFLFLSQSLSFGKRVFLFLLFFFSFSNQIYRRFCFCQLGSSRSVRFAGKKGKERKKTRLWL